MRCSQSHARVPAGREIEITAAAMWATLKYEVQFLLFVVCVIKLLHQNDTGYLSRASNKQLLRGGARDVFGL